MENVLDCAFCDRQSLEWRTIRSEELFTSIVSRPWFRKGQSLVVPNRHIVSPAELSLEEGAAIMGELGRLSLKLDEGFGAGIMQKYQPLQAENGIKVIIFIFMFSPELKMRLDCSQFLSQTLSMGSLNRVMRKLRQSPRE